MNRQQRRAAGRAHRTDAPRDLCEFVATDVRRMIHEAIAKGGDPADLVATICESGGAIVVAVASRQSLQATLDAAPLSGPRAIGARLRGRCSREGWFPVVYAGPGGAGLTEVRFHLVSRGGSA